MGTKSMETKDLRSNDNRNGTGGNEITPETEEPGGSC